MPRSLTLSLVASLLLAVSSPVLGTQKPADAKPNDKAWAGPPVVKVKWVDGGTLSTLKRLPKANEVTALRISGEMNRTNRPLTVTTFAAVLDSMRPIKADDPKCKDASFTPWCSVEFETREGKFRLSVYLGGLALVGTPDGAVGLVTFEEPVVRPAGRTMADGAIVREGRLGFYTFKGGGSLRKFWERWSEERKMKGKVSDHLTKDQIDSIILLQVNIAIPRGSYLENELPGFLRAGNRFDTGRLPERFEDDRPPEYLVALFRTKKGDYGLLTRYSTFVVIELGDLIGVAPATVEGKKDGAGSEKRERER